jgi:hypothetical protein
MTTDPRHHSPAAERNQAPILAQLLRVLPPAGSLLEIASGTGQHAAHCAAAMPGWRWQPTDVQPDALRSIDAWCDGLATVAPALQLDVLELPRALAGAPFNAVYCANLLHIAPWPTCAALMRLVATHLTPDGALVLYGPYFEDDVPASPGNLAFDADLRGRNPAWGVRRLADVAQQAQAAGFALRERLPMPANNLLLVWCRESADGESTR